MRQSEGNRTVKKHSAIRREIRLAQELSCAEAIGGPATAALAWIARIRSPLLLKTASVIPEECTLARSLACQQV